MPGRKPKSITGSVGNSAKTSISTEWKRVQLAEEDIAIAVELAGNIQALCSRIGATIADGWGFSVKFDTVRKNFSAFVVSPTDPDTGKSIGISAYAPDGLSACAACFCKWDIYSENPDKFSNANGGMGIG